MPGDTRPALVLAWVVVKGHYQVQAILEILVDDLNAPCFPINQHIKSVGTSFRMHTYAVPRFDLFASDEY
jgi:hypothetical protein